MIQVRPEVKLKGFMPENLSKVVSSSEFKETHKRIENLVSSDGYEKLKESDQKYVKKFQQGYQKTLAQTALSHDEIILSGHEVVEFSNISDEDAFRYLIYRYKYNLFPELKLVDDYPPCVQIEPVSVCNFRCVFCYQSDDSFSKKKFGHMGRMDFGLFKELIDELEGNVEAITLASRGEPLLHKDFEKMIEYIMYSDWYAFFSEDTLLMFGELVVYLSRDDFATAKELVE